MTANGTTCGCLMYHVFEADQLSDGWEGWERGGCNWQQCECACHSPAPLTSTLHACCVGVCQIEPFTTEVEANR